MDGEAAVQADALMKGWYLAIVHNGVRILWWDIIYDEESSYTEIHSKIRQKWRVERGHTAIWSFKNNFIESDLSSNWMGWPSSDRGMDIFDKIEEQAQRFGLI